MTSIDASLPVTVIFGCGYVGTRLARALLADGHPVRACARNVDRLTPLAELGAELHRIDASRPKQFGPALRGLTRPLVLYSIPPPPGLPGGEVVRRAAQAALGANAQSFVYLGTSGIYGNSPDDEWVDESTPVALADTSMASRHADEASVEAAASAGLRTTILRLGAIYGPLRGMRARLLRGELKLIDDGAHFNSRIFIDDLVTVIRAAFERAPQGSLYLVADDHPSRQREYAEWLCQRLGLPLPPSVASLSAGAPRVALRGRRLRNDKMKRELGITLRYPSFVEGEAQIEREERGEAGGAAHAEAAMPAGASATATSSSPLITPPFAPPRPLFIRHFSALGNNGGMRDPKIDERFAISTDVARPLGLRRLGVRHELVPPGRRTCRPHAHSAEEELTFVLEGHPDAWIDGTLHRLEPGDAIAFPAGTGHARTIINNTEQPVRLLVVGECERPGDRVAYPLDPDVEAALPNEQRWLDAPRHPLGSHSALPVARPLPPKD